MVYETLPGHAVIIMAPSGSGKKVFEEAARQTYPHLRALISCTTRSPRPGEENGVEYYFLSREVFQSRIDAGDFVEWAEFSGNLYGTLKSELLDALRDGEVVIADIEAQGVEQLKALLPPENLTVVYIDAGGWDILRERILRRAPISEEELTLRYERYLVESASKHLADVVIQNYDGKLAEAQDEFVSLVGRIIHSHGIS